MTLSRKYARSYDENGGLPKVMAMTIVVRLSDEQGLALEAKAAAEGLSVEQWIQRLAETADKPARDMRSGADLIAAIQASPYRDVEIVINPWEEPAARIP